MASHLGYVKNLITKRNVEVLLVPSGKRVLKMVEGIDKRAKDEALAATKAAFEKKGKDALFNEKDMKLIERLEIRNLLHTPQDLDNHYEILARTTTPGQKDCKKTVRITELMKDKTPHSDGGEGNGSKSSIGGAFGGKGFGGEVCDGKSFGDGTCCGKGFGGGFFCGRGFGCGRACGCKGYDGEDKGIRG